MSAPLSDLPSLSVTADDWQRLLLAVHASTTSEELILAAFQLMKGTVASDFTLVVLHVVDHPPMVARDSLGSVYGYEFMEQSYRHSLATARTHFANLTTANAITDTDQDGQSDLMEFTGGTSPGDPSEMLRIITSSDRRLYRVSISPDLINS
jgi:hypothetical protein